LLKRLNVNEKGEHVNTEQNEDPNLEEKKKLINEENQNSIV
jgi:hypothetical protein